MAKLISLFLFIPFLSLAQIPNGYYDPVQGLTGNDLMVALHSIIDNHTVISYNNLWNAFYDTDRKSNGKIWDIYTDIPGSTPVYVFTYSTDQCGTYAVEGDCYNREHTWPQSWFNSVSGPVSDLFHIYPTDGKVNGERGDTPYGNVGATVYYTSSNGSQIGITTDLGFNSAVFEPIDEYKGDIARSYFYMTTRYYSEDGGWTNSSATTKSAIKLWQLNVLLTWHHQDPVSSKETARNNVIYSDYQHNRNPFIDHPEWADSIWGQAVNDFVTADVGQKELDYIELYPNPTQQAVFFNLLNNGMASDLKITISDLSGKVMDFEVDKTSDVWSIKTESWDAGIYIISVANSNGVKSYSVIKH